MIESARCSTSTHSLSRLLAFYEGMDARSLLRVMINKEFKGKIALLSSFGADSAVLAHLVAEASPAIPVLFLETGKHFPETTDYVRTLTEQLGLTHVEYVRPRQDLLDAHDKEGNLWNITPNRCCWIRKVEPLKRAIEELKLEALITGRKRYQTSNRQEMDSIEIDEDNTFRINPLADWTKKDIETYMETHGLPQHPLVKEGYLSIGCAPCTRPVEQGGDERSGRWAHTATFPGAQKAECGIHLPGTASWEV